MSRKGDCWDNSVAESFFKTLKYEHVNDFSFKTRAQAKQEIFEYIEVYYNKNTYQNIVTHQPQILLLILSQKKYLLFAFRGE